MTRTFYQGCWNPDKTWEVVKLVGGYYSGSTLKENSLGVGFGPQRNIFRVLEFLILRRRRRCCEYRK